MIFNEAGKIIKSENTLIWKYGKKIKDIKLISKFEKEFNIKFPNDYKQLIKENNDASPSKYIFDTDREKEKVFGHLLSFNSDDKANIWFYNDKTHDYSISDKYIAFAADPFGNKICFEKKTLKVVIEDHETGRIDFVSNSFSEFIDSLYSK